MITIKSAREIELMRVAGQIVAQALSLAQQLSKPGISTAEMDAQIDQLIRSQNAIPSFKGYNGFPASSCISVNDQVVHGIPGSYVLKDGDIVSVDIGAIFEGYHGDAARTFAVGEITAEAQRLIDVTKQSFFEGIVFAKDGLRIGDISYAIETYVHAHGFSVVQELIGHGIGQVMHEKPDIPNYGPAGRGPRLSVGMTLAIEPMINMGKRHIAQQPDGWTIVTQDSQLSAHYENTVLITDDQPEILTLLSDS